VIEVHEPAGAARIDVLAVLEIVVLVLLAVWLAKQIWSR